MRTSKTQTVFYYIALVLSVAHFLVYAMSGSIVGILLSGLVPFWLWSTRRKLLSELSISGFEQVLSYGVLVYAVFASLFGVLMFLGWGILQGAGAEVFWEALEQNPAFDDLSEEEMQGVNLMMENLPTILPLMGFGILLQAFSYLYYGISLLRSQKA